MLGDALVEQPQGVRELLGAEHLQLSCVVAAGEVARGLAAPVEHQHVGGVVVRGGKTRGRGVRHVVRHEPHGRRVQAREGTGQEARRPAGVGLAQVVPRVVEAQLLGRPGEVGVVGVGDGVDVGDVQAGGAQAPARGQLGQLPGGERHRTLAVLAPGEPLLLRGGNRLAVDDQRGSGIVEQGVDAEDLHGWLLSGGAVAVRSHFSPRQTGSVISGRQRTTALLTP